LGFEQLTMARRALLVGIDQYDHFSNLSGCVADATAMATVLERHEDGTKNFDCRVLTSPGPGTVTRVALRGQWENLFANFTGDVLFYFSGHGTPTQVGGCIVTQDGRTGDPGLSMNELLQLANQSKAEEIFLILDCCHSGFLGNPANLPGGGIDQAQLREGVTVLAASRPTGIAVEVGGHGVFTNLVLGALEGGAADIRGNVSAAAIYAYAEQALGAWDQRPLYKSHASKLSPVRRGAPLVSDVLLRELSALFPKPDSLYQMDPSYEYTVPEHTANHVTVFDKFKLLRNGGLLKTTEGDDLYWAALHSHTVELTPLGKHFWRLANDGRI
jgi:hypothetical protein